MTDWRFEKRKMQKNCISNFCLLAEIWWQNTAKSASGSTGGSEKWISGMCRRTWCGHSHVMLNLICDAMTLSWLVMRLVSTTLSQSWTRHFFLFDQCSFASLCSRLGCSWSKRFVVYSEKPLCFFSISERDRQGRRRLRLAEVVRSSTQPGRFYPSLSALWLFFSLFTIFFASFHLWKSESLDWPAEVTSDKRPEELTRRTDKEVHHWYLPVAVLAVLSVTVFRGRCTGRRQL